MPLLHRGLRGMSGVSQYLIHDTPSTLISSQIAGWTACRHFYRTMSDKEIGYLETTSCKQ
jgi:hypothetical protein